MANLIESCPRYFDEREIKKYLNEEVESIEEALQGAEDILAQRVSEEEKIRKKVYDSMWNYGSIHTQEKRSMRIVKRSIVCTMIIKKRLVRFRVIV